MPLSNQQIERYSRQIIVADVGGVAQERLLAARIALVGSPTDVELVLHYLAGAGIGSIYLKSDGDDAVNRRLIDESREANPEVTVDAGTLPPKLDLILAMIGSAGSLPLAEALADRRRNTPLIWVRLDSPERIAILSEAPPCHRCARPSLVAPFIERSARAGFIAMLAATEAFKLLIGDRKKDPTLIEFDGYRTQMSRLEAASSTRCACRATRPGPS